MSIQVGDNFKYLGKKPIDDRMLYSTLSEMVSIPETSLYEGCKAYVIATGKEYQYKSGNTVDANTGKWRSTEVDLSGYYNKSETDNLLSGKVDKVDEMPTLTADINGKIYQYVGSDETTYKTGHFYKAIYKRRISYYWSSSGIAGYTLALPTNGLQIGDIFYGDANCTTKSGTVYAIKGDTWIMATSIYGGNYDTHYNGTTHTIEEDIRWEDVLTEIDDTQASSASTYSSSKIEGLIPTDISDLTDSTGIIPSEVKDLSDVQVGSSIADDDVLAWDSEEEKFVNKPQSGGGVSDFDELLNRPQESDAIDIDDLDLPMPAKPTEYPVLFDETGTEYQVGLYKRASDGKVKPVWRKDIINISITTNSWNTLYTNTDIDEYVTSNGHIKTTDNNCWEVGGYRSDTVYSQLQFTDAYKRLQFFLSNDSVFNNCKFYGSIEYTKTTDEWKEV